MATIRIDFFDEKGDNISKLVRMTKGKASPWHSSGIFTYSHPILGDIGIGSYSNGSIIVHEGYSFVRTEEEKDGE